MPKTFFDMFLDYFTILHKTEFNLRQPIRFKANTIYLQINSSKDVN